MIQAYLKPYAWAAIITVLLVLAVCFGISTIAHAQESAPAAPPVGAEGILALIINSGTAAIVAVVGLIFSYLAPAILKNVPEWIASSIDVKRATEALNWEPYVTSASHSAFEYAAAKLGITPDKINTYEQRADFLGWAINFINAHHDDIVAWSDKNGNGVIDILESRLASMAPNMPAPQVTSPAEEPVTLTQAQSLMGGPVRRAVTPKPFDDVKAMAPKLVRGKPATHARAN